MGAIGPYLELPRRTAKVRTNHIPIC